jgi:hypothetical protein
MRFKALFHVPVEVEINAKDETEAVKVFKKYTHDAAVHLARDGHLCVIDDVGAAHIIDYECVDGPSTVPQNARYRVCVQTYHGWVLKQKPNMYDTFLTEVEVMEWYKECRETDPHNEFRIEVQKATGWWPTNHFKVS